MPSSASVASSGQASTTTAMLASLSLNVRGRRRSARSTSASNCRRVMTTEREKESGWRGVARRAVRRAQRKGPTGGWVERARRAPRAATGPLANLESSDALDVDDVPDLADRADDVLELEEVGDLDHEVVDAPAVVGDRDLGLGDVAVA